MKNGSATQPVRAQFPKIIRKILRGMITEMANKKAPLGLWDGGGCQITASDAHVRVYVSVNFFIGPESILLLALKKIGRISIRISILRQKLRFGLRSELNFNAIENEWSCPSRLNPNKFIRIENG